MSKADLMTDDWVKTPEGNYRVLGVLNDVVYTDFRNDERDGMAFSDDLVEPISLTPEALERNGFKMFDFHDIEGQHQWSWWLDTLTSVSLWCRELNDDPKDGWMIRIEGTLAMCCHKVEYVHELQQTLRICGVDKEIEL